MYGKFFSSTFTGSMVGAGPDVFAVWGYIIANAVNGYLEINPKLLAAVLGTTVEQVESALNYLQDPDLHSRSKEHKGCRIIKEGEYQYFVVNNLKYRGLRDEDERRAYNRNKQREYRAKENSQTASNKTCTAVYHGVPKQKQEAEAYKQEDQYNLAQAQASVSTNGHALREWFDTKFWPMYPRKVSKGAAWKAIAKLKPTQDLRERIVISLGKHAIWTEWTKDNGKFIPYPATWINAEGWENDTTDPIKPGYHVGSDSDVDF